jgi:hypothetical protein
VPGVINDPTVFAVAGIPSEISQVMPLPEPTIMEKLISAVLAP